MNRIINYLFDVVRGVLFYFSQTKLRTALTLLGITVGVSSIIFETNFSNCFPYGTANNPESATETVLNLSLTQDFI